jgi:hypothetical protein
MLEIDIATVLNKLNDTIDEKKAVSKSYGLRFIKATGECRELICRKNVRAGVRGKYQFSLKDRGLVQVTADNETHPRLIKPTMIYGFKDYQSDVWLNVFH